MYHHHSSAQADFEKSAAAASHLINLYKETFDDLMRIGVGCHALLAEMAHRNDPKGIREQLSQLVGKLDQAAAVLRH